MEPVIERPALFPPQGDLRVWASSLITTLVTVLQQMGYVINKLIRRYNDIIDPREFGALGDGVNDDTQAFKLALEYGGDIFISEGEYLIAGTGADSGGVIATLTRSTVVRCAAGARFVTDSLDNDFFRLSVPSNGAGLPADGIEFEWHGGVFDQRNQKNSTVIPFIADYPPTSAGSSATCDALAIRGDYNDGTEHHGIKRALVEGVTCLAGDHWEIAGGDSGVFISGCAIQTVRGCRMVGNRDLAIYGSGSPNGTLMCKTYICDNEFINCFHGASVKRSAGETVIAHNYAENCVRGYLIDLVAGSQSRRVIITGNTGRNCGIPIRLTSVTGFSVTDNQFGTLGALLEDGSSVEDVAGCFGLQFIDCEQGSVSDNRVLGLQSGIAAAYPTAYHLIDLDANCSRVVCSRNVGDGLRTAGSDAGASNAYVENYVVNAVTSANFATVGTNYFEMRVDPTTMFRSFTNPVGFADGDVTNPIIARRAQTSVGLRFAANLMGMVVAGADAIRVDNSTTAGQTRMFVYDVDNGQIERVTVGAADSGGAGFKVLRIAN